MTAKMKNPSVLAFESKLAVSDAIMSAGNWETRTQSQGWKPVTVEEKSVRGTISNRQKTAIASDPLKLDAEIQKPNLQTVDNAALPFDCDTLKLYFTLRILGDLQTPSTCNEPDYQALLADKINTYAAGCGFAELAGRYASNLANGRFLWRNRVGAEQVEVRISAENGDSWTFDALACDLYNFEQPSGNLAQLAAVIERGLSGKGYAFVTVEAFVKLGAGQSVYPSQELIMGQGKGDKSKHLYQLDGVAAMHSQKIGNALRTIDTWHPEASSVGPIAIEPYGSVTNRGKAYRQPAQKIDFYSLLDGWMLKASELTLEQQHYVIAMLIRGGVFGATDK